MRRRLHLTALVLMAAGCASAAPRPAAQDRYSPDRMRSGPSLTETGRFGVTPVSRGGVHIEDARAEGPPPAAPPLGARSRRGTRLRTSDRKRTTPR
ncbi:MAG TPA: hypothetical protein VHM31_20065 [Polyangia bacterium]|nr:hypothetical protein [Polyangia bacterium]